MLFKKTYTRTKILYFSMFLSPLLLGSGMVAAQTPGGIGIPEVWFKTTPITTDLQGSYRWQDFSGDSVKLNVYDSRGPLYGSEFTNTRSQIFTYNFNPAMNLSATTSNTNTGNGNGNGKGNGNGNGNNSNSTNNSVNKEFLLSGTNLAQGTIIGVWGTNSNFDQDMVMYSAGGRAGEEIIMTKDKVAESVESGLSALDYGSSVGMDLMYHKGLSSEPTISKFQERALRVQSYYRLNGHYYRDVWGERQQAVITVGANYDTANVNNNATFNLSNLNNIQFSGYTPEMLIYNRLLTPLEKVRVESYLALKYGFTLAVSYISSKNRLIWDLAADTGYNTRITGICRDDASGLYQSMSTTSYEDSPYYSNVYESFYNSNSYNLPSPNRLLVMGRPFGTNMTDGDYTIWGDDNQSFRVPATGARVIGGMKTMSRNWKVRTDVVLPPNSAGAQSGLWSYNGLQMVTGTNSSTIIKESTDAVATGTAVTTQPLSGLNGYFSFVYDVASSGSGDITIKFGTQSPAVTANANDYGYYIDVSKGQIFPIVSGVQSNKSIASVSNNQKIEIEKRGDIITLRVNDVAITGQDIMIASGDSLKSYYGTLQVNKGKSDIQLTAFTANGFFYGSSGYNSNGGHRLELSYDPQRASDFSLYRNGQTYLIVDRSGTGTYPANATDYYVSDEVDETRTKIIFNNIQWDTDGNGSDVFTFGYIPSGQLVISVDSSDASCTNGVANNDGVIKVNVISGLKGLNYKIVNTGDTSIQRSGLLFADTLQVDSLPAGAYAITMSELGGYDFQSSSSSSFRPSAVSAGSLRNADCSVDFLAGVKDSAAAVGFAVSSAKTLTVSSGGFNLPNYGVQKIGGQLYLLTQGNVSSTPIGTVQTGDKITVAKSGNNLVISVNGAVISTTSIAAADQSQYWLAAVTLPAGVAGSELANLNITGFAGGTWLTSDNMTESLSSSSVATATATVSADCSPVAEEAVVPEPTPAPVSVPTVEPLSIYYRSTGNMKSFTAKLTLNKPGEGASQLLVFNMSGRLVYQTMLSNNQKVQTVNVTLQVPGVYIVKAITPEGEYSKKALIR